MWVEFVVGSRPCYDGFSPGSPVFLPPQKPTLLNSNSTWNARTPLNEFLELFGTSWVNKLQKITFPFLSTELITKGKLATVKRLECQRFECQAFVHVNDFIDNY